MSNERACACCGLKLPPNQLVIVHIPWPLEMISSNLPKTRDYAFCDFVHLYQWLDKHSREHGWAREIKIAA